MQELFYIISNTVLIAIMALQFAMLIRAIMSWFISEDAENPFVNFIYTVTEIIVAPVRNFFDRRGWFEGFPFDLSFLVSYILLSAVMGLLTMFG